MNRIIKLLSIMVMILFATSASYGWQYIHDIDYSWDFETSSEGWVITDEFDTGVTFRGIEFYDVTETGEYLLMSYDFHPKHLGIEDKDSSDWKDTMFSCRFGYLNNKRHLVKFNIEIALFDNENLHFYNIEEPGSYLTELTTGEGITVDLSNTYLNYECVKSIKIYANVIEVHPDYEMLVFARNLSITNLVRMNPEIEGYLQAIAVCDKVTYSSGDDIVLSLELYYGIETQEVDIYIVFYNGTQLLFLPSLTTEIEFWMLELEQYTMCLTPIELCTFQIDLLNPSIGVNTYTIGIAEKGTLNFMNELYIQKFYYE